MNTRRPWGYAASLLMAALVGYLLLMPMTGGPGWPIPHVDKLIHLALFFAVALPALRVAPHAAHWPLFGIVTGYSALLELVQPTVGRSADPLDLAANAAGAGLAVGAARALSRRAKVQQRQGPKPQD